MQTIAAATTTSPNSANDIETADNIDDIAARAKAAGVVMTKEPHDTEWGSRAFDVTEPSGFLLTIASPAAK